MTTSFKGILLDIDNTLYDYESSHKVASAKTFEHIVYSTGHSLDHIKQGYKDARETINSQLITLASSHNRLLYFQLMLEKLNINRYSLALEFYHLYWETFVANIRLFEGVLEFLETNGHKTCFLTDLTLDVQLLKIKKLELDRFNCKLVTSEEVGKEKPSKYMFLAGMHKLGCTSTSTCMIGDSMEKDIKGAVSLGIKAFYFNPVRPKAVYDNPLISTVKSFKELNGILNG